MSIAAGRLRHRVEIQQQVSTVDSSGETSIEWETVDTVWAAVEPLSAREYIAAQQIGSQITTRITIRYRDDIVPSMRILHGSTIYNIQGVLADADSGIEYLTLPCSAGRNDG